MSVYRDLARNNGQSGLSNEADMASMQEEVPFSGQVAGRSNARVGGAKIYMQNRGRPLVSPVHIGLLCHLPGGSACVTESRRLPANTSKLRVTPRRALLTVRAEQWSSSAISAVDRPCRRASPMAITDQCWIQCRAWQVIECAQAKRRNRAGSILQDLIDDGFVQSGCRHIHRSAWHRPPDAGASNFSICWDRVRVPTQSAGLRSWGGIDSLRPPIDMP